MNESTGTILNAMSALGDVMVIRCGELADGKPPRDDLDRAFVRITEYIAECNGAKVESIACTAIAPLASRRRGFPTG